MIIRSDKILLRTPSLADLPYIRKLWADPVTMKDVGGPVAMDEEKSQRWFQRMADPGSETDRYFLVCGIDGMPVGEISFHRYDRKKKTAELNVKIEAGRRYGGHGPEALRLMLGYFFDEYGGEGMEDPLAPENRNGMRALRAAGFQRDLTRQDVVMMRLTKERYHKLYKE